MFAYLANRNENKNKKYTIMKLSKTNKKVISIIFIIIMYLFVSVFLFNVLLCANINVPELGYNYSIERVALLIVMLLANTLVFCFPIIEVIYK